MSKELVSLNVDNLDIEELEARLEFGALVPSISGCIANCGSNNSCGALSKCGTFGVNKN